MVGGAQFMSSFGPGRYEAFVCVDWMLDYDIGTASNSSTSLKLGDVGGFDLADPVGGGVGSGMIQEWGAYVNSFPTQGSVHLTQLYGGTSFPSPTLSSVQVLLISHLTGSEQGILLTFAPNPSKSKPSTILARVGVSFISTSKACANAESEIPDPSGGGVWDFEGVRDSAKRAWNDVGVLGGVKVGLGVPSTASGDGSESQTGVMLSGMDPSTESVTSTSTLGTSSIIERRAAKSSSTTSPSASVSAPSSSSSAAPGSGSGAQLDKDTVELFYSSLYRTHIVPADCKPDSPLGMKMLKKFLVRYWREPELELH